MAYLTSGLLLPAYERGGLMITLDKFIEKRLKDDKKNLLDLDNKENNLQDYVTYIFEYFNTYINIDESRRLKIENDEKIEKYYWQIEKYSTEVQNWLIEVYSKYNKKINQQIPKLLKDIDVFLLTNSSESFRKYSYKCYSQLIKKYPFMENYTEQLYEFILDEHRILSNNYQLNQENETSFNEKIDKYIITTADKYKVNLFAWAEVYSDNFFGYEHMWPVGACDIEEYGKSYNPMKAKKNKFNIDSIYSQISTLPYIKGRKKILEILVMYYWQKDISPVDGELYEDYMKQACDSI